ncbi:MAG: hypothetical protein SGCHY_001194 [Lobulomycetales sp.]
MSIQGALDQLLRRSELRVSARGLSTRIIKHDLPVTSVVLFTKRKGEWKEIARTEIIESHRDPDFQTALELEHYLGQEQTLKFSLVHYSLNQKRETEVGFVVIEANEITKLNGSITRSLTIPGSTVKQGMLKIVAEEAIPHSGTIVWSLERKELLRKNNTFYTISRQQLDQTYMLVYRSSPVLRTLDPVWSPVEIDKSTLCGEHDDREIKIEVFHSKQNGNQELIGFCTTTFAEVVSKRNLDFELINPKGSSPPPHLTRPSENIKRGAANWSTTKLSQFWDSSNFQCERPPGIKFLGTFCFWIDIGCVGSHRFLCK